MKLTKSMSVIMLSLSAITLLSACSNSHKKDNQNLNTEQVKKNNKTQASVDKKSAIKQQAEEKKASAQHITKVTQDVSQRADQTFRQSFESAKAYDGGDDGYRTDDAANDLFYGQPQGVSDIISLSSTKDGVALKNYKIKVDPDENRVYDISYDVYANDAPDKKIAKIYAYFEDQVNIVTVDRVVYTS